MRGRFWARNLSGSRLHRGGVGTVRNELARDANVAVVLDEPLLPVRPPVAAACELLGIDPLYVANEGELIIIVPPDHPHDALAALRAHPHGGDAVRIGEIHPDPPGIVVLRTPMSGTRMVNLLVGDPLPVSAEPLSTERHSQVPRGTSL